ncbi:MAG: hypothetical protein ACMXYK_03435 [Candidatus Woesearchaeota archaeon]
MNSIEKLEIKNNVININSLTKKLKNEKDKNNKKAIISEIKVVYILSQNNSFAIDCSGALLPNGKRTDPTISFNKLKVLTEIYSPWKEKHRFIEKIKQEGAAGITSIEMLKKITSEKYCDENGKCQFSPDEPHLFIIDLDDSMTDEFPIINKVSEFARAFSCKVYPSGNAGVFHEKDKNMNYQYTNISGVIGIKNCKITEFIENPNAKNKLTSEFIDEIGKLKT